VPLSTNLVAILSLMASSSRITHHVTKKKSSQPVFLIMTMGFSTQMAFTVTRSQSNRATLDVVEWEICILDVQLTNLQRPCDVVMSIIWTKIAEKCFQHLVESRP